MMAAARSNVHSRWSLLFLSLLLLSSADAGTTCTGSGGPFGDAWYGCCPSHATSANLDSGTCDIASNEYYTERGNVAGHRCFAPYSAGCVESSRDVIAKLWGGNAAGTSHLYHRYQVCGPCPLPTPPSAPPMGPPSTPPLMPPPLVPPPPPWRPPVNVRLRADRLDQLARGICLNGMCKSAVESVPVRLHDGLGFLVQEDS
jgi:hypothetical protein